jgi:predicted transcriptional regulator
MILAPRRARMTVAGNVQMCYVGDMSPGTKTLLERFESWPEEDQEELADVAREIESRRSGVYRLSDEERAAVRAGMDDAHRGDFASDEEMDEFFRLHHRA